ncbi:MAG: glycosyltransferase family 2 protein [Pseudomonadota bacterium]
MIGGKSVTVIIPALNEEASIARVIDLIPNWVDRVIVADNGSTDSTARLAEDAGAEIVAAPRRGYGSACLAGIDAAGPTDVMVFLDGDLADDPTGMSALVEPIVDGRAELVIGSRTLGIAETGALTFAQRFGNRLACTLLRIIWGARFTDLGPFRAIECAALRRLAMQDPDYGWTVEMQIKAARHGLVCLEVPVPYRRRVGRSKISGTIRGTLAAGAKILWIIAKHSTSRRQA